MDKIRVKNFGPIKNGYTENAGWIEINRVTVFIGNQGSGKSTVAKLISTLKWLEKALIRGDVKLSMTQQDLIELFEFHRLENYFQQDTLIEFQGDSYLIKISYKNKTIIYQPKLINNKTQIKQPKIMYVPAERNFLSSISNINKVSDLIVGSLKNYSVEFRNAQLDNIGKSIDLPINETKVKYDPKEDENYLLFNNSKLKLSDASSGFHSIVPLFWVTQYLTEFLKQTDKKLLELLSTDQTVRRNNELKELNKSVIDEKRIRNNEKLINTKYISKYFVNIVEEPEQNLFPSSQRLLLNSLLSFNNDKNMLIMTTHSPYLINYLTLAVEADKLKMKINSENLKEQLNEIVPLNSTLNGNDLAIYQLKETKGEITKLKTYRGLPSDDNFLNDGLAESNELFSKLLDIEDLCQ